MDNLNKKCSFKDHQEVNANSYCRECKIFMCNKCLNLHNQLFPNHHQINLEENSNEIFSGICQEKNHKMKLEYFCKTHNILCCSACLSSIKTNGNGKHRDCVTCSLKKIKNIKKNKLSENILYLEKLSNTIEQSINELKNVFKIINENKENLKIKIQKIFTILRNEINKREDEILLNVDKKFSELFFDEELIQKSEKLPKKINYSLEKGKIEEKDWNDKTKLNSLINNCVNVENNLKDINLINESIQKCNSINDLNIKFNPEENEIDKFLNTIKNFGELYYGGLNKVTKDIGENIINNFKEENNFPLYNQFNIIKNQPMDNNINFENNLINSNNINFIMQEKYN